MASSDRAVRPARFKPNGAGSIESRVANVEGRMDALENTLAANRAAAAAESTTTQNLLKELIEALGRPSNGPAHPATGIYWALDKMGDRVATFERRFEQFKGGLKAITFAAVPMGVLIWFLAGDKITKLLHG